MICRFKYWGSNKTCILTLECQELQLRYLQLLPILASLESSTYRLSDKARYGISFCYYTCVVIQRKTSFSEPSFKRG